MTRLWRWGKPYVWQISALRFLAHPFIFLGGAFVLGVVLIAMNMIWGHHPSGTPAVWSEEWWLALGEKLGYILAVSGILGVVSRILWATGVLAGALSDVMVGDGFLAIRKDLPDLWRKLTQRIYMHGFEVETPGDQFFLDRVYAALDRSVAQRHDFYAEDMDAHYRIEASEGGDNLLKVTKTITYWLYPYRVGEPIEHITEVIAADGVPMEDYGVEEAMFKVNSENVERAVTIQEDKVIRSVTLSDAERFQIEREATSLVLLVVKT